MLQNNAVSWWETNYGVYAYSGAVVYK